MYVFLISLSKDVCTCHKWMLWIFIRLILGITGLSYEEGLSRLDCSLEFRIMRGDLIIMHKVHRRHGYSVNINVGPHRAVMQRHFFTQRVVNFCNSILVVCGGSIIALKIEINRFLDIRGIEGYGENDRNCVWGRKWSWMMEQTRGTNLTIPSRISCVPV